MLKTINPLLTGTILGVLADMGHGDEIVLTDANFPASSVGQRVIELPGILATEVLSAILTLLPLDDFVDAPAAVIDVPGERPAIYAEFEKLVVTAEGRAITIEAMDRFAFVERAEGAYAVIATGERRLYGNIILKKGVLRN
jgi:L-fucose mutarotase